MRRKIFRSLLLIAVLVLLLSSVISTAFLHTSYNAEQAQKLSVELELVADAVNRLGTDYLAGVEDDTFRFTVVGRDGAVLYDTKADSLTMGNHGDREEILEALQTGRGSSARYSATLTEKTFYEAVKLDDGSVLRISTNQLSMGGAILMVLPRNGRQYQFNISPIEADGSPVGTLILAFDITDKAFAERNRREFTANVSHELKTPLQGIIGSAELLESGLVKPEDTPRFVANIKNEAARLVTLIDDIIRLSQLDEKTELARETVDLAALCQEVSQVLAPAAEKKGVSLHLSCDKIDIQGVRRYLFEVVYNLCDNAIRYNRDGGRMEVTLKQDGAHTQLSVSDTGIGIAPEHQARIFERFYRVDKSHSKETGGTGLGLSIVKHAVQYHNAQLRLESVPGKGTTITVLF